MTDSAASPHYLVAMRLALLVLAAACVTEPAEDHAIISKVAYREIPFSRTMLTYGVACYEMELPEPYDCTVELVAADRTSEMLLPSCDASPTAMPCWRISADEALCQDAKHQYLDFDYTDLPDGQHYVIAQCVSL